jgi:phospholipase D-like protein
MGIEPGHALGIVFILGLFLLGVIALAAFVFWIWMLIHAITNKGLTDTEKLIWVVVILFLHFLGGLIYFFVGRPKQEIINTKPLGSA